MTMKLHILPMSPHARKVMALAEYLELPVEVVIPEFGTMQNDASFLQMNPNAKVPVLEDGDHAEWESNSILCYLAEKAGSDLWLQDTKQQHEIYRWLLWEASHYSPALLGVYFQKVIKPLLNMGEPDHDVIQEKLGFTERFAKVLDDRLARQAFVVGDNLTVADFSIGAITETTKLTQIDLSAYENIQAWLLRLRSLKGWSEITPARETSLPLAA